MAGSDRIFHLSPLLFFFFEKDYYLHAAPLLWRVKVKDLQIVGRVWWVWCGVVGEVWVRWWCSVMDGGVVGG